MIYKLNCKHENSHHSDALEFFAKKTEQKDFVVFECFNENVGATEIYLNKEDVFRLIGALHLLHKEMK